MRLLNTFLSFSDTLAPLIVLLVFLVKQPRLSAGLHYILLFSLIQFLFNTLSTVLEHARITNYPVYFFNTLFSFMLLSSFFSSYALKISKTKTLAINASFILISAIAWKYGEGVTAFNSYQSSLANLLITAGSLHYFYYHFVSVSASSKVTETAVFWCVIGLFTYYAGSFLISITYKTLIAANTANIGTLWRFHNILLLACCLYISYGILWKQSPKTSL